MAKTETETASPRHYTFPVASELLRPKPIKEIGDAIWCFLWCVDRTTSEIVRNGECQGRVLGGYVVPTRRISEELGLSAEQVGEQLKRLSGARYLRVVPRDDGYVIEVRRSIKWKNCSPKRTVSPVRRGGDPTPMKSLVEGLRERLAAREAQQREQGGNLS